MPPPPRIGTSPAVDRTGLLSILAFFTLFIAFYVVDSWSERRDPRMEMALDDDDDDGIRSTASLQTIDSADDSSQPLASLTLSVNDLITTEEKEEEQPEENGESSTTTPSEPIAIDENDDDPPNSTTVVAPRTSHVPYNQYVKGRRYLIYSPSGGFNNQRECLQNAMQIARMTNRILYVPMVAKHMSGWKAYERLSLRYLFPADRVLDFERLDAFFGEDEETGFPNNRSARVVPLMDTVEGFVKKFVNANGPNSVKTVFQPDREEEPWTRVEVLRYLVPPKQPLLYLRGALMYHNWFSIPTMVRVRRYVRASQYFRLLAMELAEETLGKRFYAIHIRLGDYSERWGKRNSGYFVDAGKKAGWKTHELPVYVATELDQPPAFYQAINRAWNVTYLASLNTAKLAPLRSLFPRVSGSLKNDIMGVLEQLICVCAEDFLGSDFSSFTAYIRFMRTFRGEVYPELMRDGDAMTTNQEKNLTTVEEEEDDERPQ